MRTRTRTGLALIALLAIVGCEGFGRGVTQAVLEGSSEPTEDTRSCEVEGRPFPGIEPFLEAQDRLPPFTETESDRPEVKVLYVHGIGTHVPGDGTALRNNLASSLGLEVRAPRPKRIVIAHPGFPEQNLGEINISRLVDTAHRRDLLFYELTWSPITQSDKDLLAFDKEQDYVLRRAAVNQAMRTFVNDIAPDPLAYAGTKREPILASVSQSVCWMAARSWGELPELTENTACGPSLPAFGSRLAVDDMVIITHSLGSRATLDALQSMADLPIRTDPKLAEFADELARSDLQVFMLSNQLPLLEAGREGQQVVGQNSAYCGPSPTKPGRFFEQTRIIAFSDPNDLMSYPVPDQFANKYIEFAAVPERHEHHDQRRRGELFPGTRRGRQPAWRAYRLRARRAGRSPDRQRRRQPQCGAARGRALHLARDRREPDAVTEVTMATLRLIWQGAWPGLCIAALLALSTPLGAQEATAPDPAAAEVSTDIVVVDDEVRALVAPVALYPDPLLAVILQASMFPVDVVQADRFIQRYQEDQTLEPSEDWDPSLYGLLAYPSILAEMNDHLDWTQAMGDAVYDQLDAVQDSIQDLRQGAYAMGVLATNEVQEVIVEEGIVQIRPTTEELVAIPEYDGAALLASLEPVREAPPTAAAADEAVSGEANGLGDDDVAEREAALAQREADLAAREADVAEREQAENESAVGDEVVVADAEYVDEAAEYVEPAAVDPYAASYAAAAPTYAQPPVYAAPPPPVAYAEPSSSFWGTTGTFLGGAAVGGLLGYAIFDDDDNNNNGGGNNNRRNDINIEDSTIVVGGSGDQLNLDRDTKKRVNQDLRDRRDRADGINRDRSRSERRDRDRQVSALPGKRDTSRQREQRRDVSLPQRDRERSAKVQSRDKRAAPALKAPKQKKGAVANVKRPSQTKKDASRGKQSREKAAKKRAQPQRQIAQRSGGGKKKALAAKKGGKKKAKAKSNRGKKSRGKKKRRG